MDNDSVNTTNTMDLEKPNGKIKHIVISGGGVSILSFYGAFREANKQGLWDISNIQSIYGTSAGSLLGVVLLLKYDWDIIDNYIIHRPWQNVFKCNMYSIMNSFQERGIFGIKIFEEILLPLFKGKDISGDITMGEFYDYTGVDLHIFAVDINNFESVDISHKTYPDWKVIEAVYASCSLPFIFQPFVRDGVFYTDGGFLVNYPLTHCINNGANPDEILGICKTTTNTDAKANVDTDASLDTNAIVDTKANNLTSDSNVFDYLLLILSKMLKKISVHDVENNIKIKHKIDICSPYTTLPLIINTASSMDERLAFIEVGAKFIREQH